MAITNKPAPTQRTTRSKVMVSFVILFFYSFLITFSAKRLVLLRLTKQDAL